MMHGGDLVAEVLLSRGVRFIFTLCGGHISPILVGCKQRNIRVIDVRHEVNAVFAADAVSRLTGVPGVAAVTAGPGVTNTITAVKNAQLAQSPLVLFGGATATALRGRGSLQDIDQMALIKPHVKWARRVTRVKDLAGVVQQAFDKSLEGVPGPVFIECPVDLLYDESLVREWYGLKSGGKAFSDKMVQKYLNFHVNRLFKGTGNSATPTITSPGTPEPSISRVKAAAAKLEQAKRPVMLVGSQAVLDARSASEVAAAVDHLGIPVYLSGMARGLLGKANPLQMRHKRRLALKEADLVILAGVPSDFRLDYGRHIRRSSYLISANRSAVDIKKNRRPNLAVRGDAGQFLRKLSDTVSGKKDWREWIAALRKRDEAREAEIHQTASEATEHLNPVHLCREMRNAVADKSILVADGGDFVATASYIVPPSGPLTWLDPGVFGTLGVGAGFALGAKLCQPEAEVWIIYGDGSVGYSISEFDTFVRHNTPVIAVVGNDASWMQIAREQVEVLKDDVGTTLLHSDYHRVAEGFGGKGFLLKDAADIASVLEQAKAAAKSGQPVLVNALLGKTDFRKGSISM